MNKNLQKNFQKNLQKNLQKNFQKNLLLGYINPPLFNAPGDWGNLLILRNILLQNDYPIQIQFIENIHDLDTLPDFLYSGGNLQNSLTQCAAFFQAIKPKLKLMIENGYPCLFTGLSYALLGEKINLSKKKSLPGLALWNLESSVIPNSKQYHGPFLGQSRIFGKVYGFQNQNFEIMAKDSDLDYLCQKLEYGKANNGKVGEGTFVNKAIGTQVSGPLLAKNPAIVKYFCEEITKNEDFELDQKYLSDVAKSREKAYNQ